MPGPLKTLYARLHSSLASPSMLPAPTKAIMGMTWQEIANKAQQHRDATIALVEPPIPDIEHLPLNSTPIPKTILTPAEISITESDPADLVSKLASGTLSSSEVTKAFLRRAALAQKLTNCVTELLTTAALERAAYLDAYLEEHGNPVGPLHGLPISVKEHVGMKGLAVNAGFISWHDKVADADAHILDILFAAGAVFYVRTTQPQTLMHLETSTNFYGTTVNPYNRDLTSGGSSGGEGALVGIRGSCLGIGTDIGGSIRSPAANNGVYGLRPTSYRLPMEGLSATMLGQEQVVPVIGPLSPSLDGVKLFMKTLIDAQPWVREPSLIPIPWRTESQLTPLFSSGKKLRIGLLLDDGVVKPHPPVVRALKAVAEKLKDVPGIDIVEWEPYKHDYAWDIISSLYFCDGGSEEIAAMEESGEPWRPLSEFILKQPNVKKHGIRDVWDWTMKREGYKAEYSQLLASRGVDMILCPVGPGVAPQHDTSRYWGYTSQWNLLDYPALVAPVTKVDPNLDLAEAGYKPRNEKDKYNYELYSPKKYLNAPVSLQLVGRRYDDEKVIETWEYIKEKIGLPFAEL
ncbi:putative glutamyl-tRNA amidotransferase subunit A [Corynespora cassiicola Philippines]|uniref:amidase n=1 Tax=Corynespora cassiicola Philippines TaxID=1448308 RepID=A0A2T2NXS7_CORCC|nr:putative glutamyl-tRNA amidotransferase subunit A [Corynespora cassiicola Philippines]